MMSDPTRMVSRDMTLATGGLRKERIAVLTSLQWRDPLSRDTSTTRTLKPISNVDEVFRQWTTYSTVIIARGVTVMSEELSMADR